MALNVDQIEVDGTHSVAFADESGQNYLAVSWGTDDRTGEKGVALAVRDGGGVILPEDLDTVIYTLALAQRELAA